MILSEYSLFCASASQYVAMQKLYPVSVDAPAQSLFYVLQNSVVVYIPLLECLDYGLSYFWTGAFVLLFVVSVRRFPGWRSYCPFFVVNCYDPLWLVFGFAVLTYLD